MTKQIGEAAEYEFIVVGSGAGGGPLAANLARGGYRVLLLEAGGDHEDHTYQVPAFHGLASEQPDMRWDFFVKHYENPVLRRRDSKNTPERDGVLYPRAGTLGGCTAHNAMITVMPTASDWNGIAEATGDESWRADRMQRYFERLEDCRYLTRTQRFIEKAMWKLRLSPTDNPSGHGYGGWLTTTKVDPRIALPDERLVWFLFKSVLTTIGAGVVRRLARIFSIFAHFDPNDLRVARESPEGLVFAPLAIKDGRRTGPRDFIRATQAAYPERLTVRTNCLVTRVLLDSDDRATGVEYMEGSHLYRADRDPDACVAPDAELRTVGATREVILATGAFNTPQLLMLSGIGPRDELERHDLPVRVELPGVGRNLQDRYEVGVVAEMRKDFEILADCTFAPPAEGTEPEKAFLDWKDGKGVYTSNGVVLGVVKRSQPDLLDPDLFIFGIPGYFKGYFPGYSEQLVKRKNYFTWAVLKAHTKNTAGFVRLRSADPRDAPDIVFHYFDEGNDARGDDLDAVVDGVRFVRSILEVSDEVVKGEVVPGPEVASLDQLRTFVKDEAWGHHASCTCPMGSDDDPMAVLDSRFRVRGVDRLRVVDASVFPRIPGFFIVSAIYMVSEKASDVIMADAGRRPRLTIDIAQVPGATVNPD
ncbi:MAG: glucose-methanol-choline oxidoreductase [Gemmatimonas sp.]|nr:glucose-methanol-choline oxidoreductase [Gemmatimonas sp.]